VTAAAIIQIKLRPLGSSGNACNIRVGSELAKKIVQACGELGEWAPWRVDTKDGHWWRAELRVAGGLVIAFQVIDNAGDEYAGNTEDNVLLISYSCYQSPSFSAFAMGLAAMSCVEKAVRSLVPAEHFGSWVGSRSS